MTCCQDCKNMPCDGEYCTTKPGYAECEVKCFHDDCPAVGCERFRKCKPMDRE